MTPIFGRGSQNRCRESRNLRRETGNITDFGRESRNKDRTQSKHKSSTTKLKLEAEQKYLLREGSARNLQPATINWRDLPAAKLEVPEVSFKGNQQEKVNYTENSSYIKFQPDFRFARKKAKVRDST